MKRLLHLAPLALLLLILSGCHEKFIEAIEKIEQDVDEIEALVKKYNTNLTSINALATVISSHDMITGITEYKDEGKYDINFVNHESITIYDGLDGDIPAISYKRDEKDDNTYWTVQYSDGKVEYIKDSNGNKIPAVGTVPYITIRNGKWYITYDSVTYVELGQAKGDDADKMFKSINTKDPDYVIITLSSGEVLKIPTFTSYKNLKKQVDMMDTLVSAQRAIIQAKLDSLTYITALNPILSDEGDTLGVRLNLSDGQYCTIYDARRSNIPFIYAKTYIDGRDYWVVEYSDAAYQWILDDEGKMILAVGVESKTPVVGMAQDTSSDYRFYWTISVDDEPVRFITDSTGNKILAKEEASNAIFESIAKDSQNFLTINLKDSTSYRLPMEYAIDIKETLWMKSSGIVAVPYTVYGDNDKSTVVTPIVPEGFRVIPSGSNILIQAPSNFTTAQITLLFNICGLSYRTIIRTIDIVKE